MTSSCRAARGGFPRGVAADGGRAPAAASLRPVLVAASVSAMLSSPAAAAPAREPAPDTFELTATERNFENYYPTYLANGYWSMASSLSGTGPTPEQMTGVVDYTAAHVLRPAAVPSWHEMGYIDGVKV